MKPLPKVSVIIPNYNHAAFIERRINTVLHQTFTDFEVIILDDCSRDNSREIINQYRQHPKVANIIFNETNSGSPFVQWKKGLEYASGDWIWIAETDDYAELNFLEELIQQVLENESTGLVYSDSKAINNQGELIEGFLFSEFRNRTLNTNHWSRDYHNNGLCELEDYLLFGGTINNTSAVLFRRDVLIDANPFDKNFRFIGDKYAFVKVLCLSDISYVNKPLNYYRVNFGATDFGKNRLQYYYEQFVIFDWILKSKIRIDKAKFNKAFHHNLQVSFYKGWTMDKLKTFKSLASINFSLFVHLMVFNLFNPILTRFNGK